MSHVTLQRVMVRMLFDPMLAQRVLEDSRAALGDVALHDDEHAWLVRPDRRAWFVDPERPARALGSLVLRFPTSVAASIRSGTGIEDLLQFFRSEAFHRSVQERGSMATAFAAHLIAAVRSGRIADRRVEPLVQLEHAMARLLVEAPRQPPPPAPSAGSYVLSPDKRLHRAPAGTADLHETMYGLLASFAGGLAVAIVDTSVTLPDDGIDFGRDETLLLELVRGDGWRVSHVVGASEIPAELNALLVFASAPRSHAALEAETQTLGAARSEAREVVTRLIEEGTLVSFAGSRARRSAANDLENPGAH